MDKHREQFHLARQFADLYRNNLPDQMKHCYLLFVKWHASVDPKPLYSPLNEYQFRTVLRKPHMARKPDLRPPKFLSSQQVTPSATDIFPEHSASTPT